MIPMQNNWIPPIITMIQIIDGHPEVGSPNIKVLTMINMMNRNAITHIKIPKKEASANGAVEKAMIPSKE